jgi:TRAP-type mannitol/chloroaromatic compound transport system permease large subunit
MESAGLWMLGAAAILMLSTGLPAWMVLVGVALGFSIVGAAAGVFAPGLLAALHSRLVGLLENDLLQALPLYVLMGALINRLPLADLLFRAGARALDWTGCGRALAGLGLGVLLAPMSGSVGASASMLTRTVYPRLDGPEPARNLALVCMASTLGVVVPPSLVLILLGDAMLRAHTEAANVTGLAGRIINTQDVFHAALIPAAILLVLCAAIVWWTHRGKASDSTPLLSGTVPRGEWITAIAAISLVIALLAGVALGYLYAVEAAATGGMALATYGLLTRTLDRKVLAEALDDTIAITGALFALLVAATFFTLVQRAFGTDRWLAAAFAGAGSDANLLLAAVLAGLALCAFVLDAFEMIFVVIPLVIPPLLTRVTDATWVAVLTLLILQASFLVPPFGYAVLMARSRIAERVSSFALARALAPYVVAQALVLAIVLAWPQLLWRDAQPGVQRKAPMTPQEDEKARDLFEEQLQKNEEK